MLIGWAGIYTELMLSSLSPDFRDSNTHDRGTPIEAPLSERWHPSNREVLTPSLSPQVQPPPPRSYSLWVTTPTSSASMTSMAALFVT